MELVDGDLLFAGLLAPVFGSRDARGRRVEQQILRQAALFFGERGEAFQAFGVDDGEVEAGFGRVVEEHGVHHFARGRRQAEGDVGDSQHRLDVGDFGLHHADRLDGLYRASDVVFVARRTREDQGVDDDVFGRDAVLFGQDLHGALGYGQFALAGEGLRLLFIFVDGADDQRTAVGSDQRADELELFLAVFEVDGIDDALALAPDQCAFRWLWDRWYRPSPAP